MGLKKRILHSLPTLLRGAIDAAATPNIAGGGATDIFRSMQAAEIGRDRRRDRELDREMQQQRQRQIDQQIELDRLRTEADIELKKKHGNYYDKFGDYRDALGRKMDDPLKNTGGAIYNRDTGEWLVPPKSPKLVNRPEGIFRIGETGDPEQVFKGEPRRPNIHWRTVIGDDGTITHTRPGENGTPEVQRVDPSQGRGKTARPAASGRRGAGAGAPRPATPNQFASVEERKKDDWAKSQRQAEAEVAAIRKSTFNNQPDPAREQEVWDRHKARTAAIQQSYLQQIDALNRNQRPATPGAAAAPQSDIGSIVRNYLDKKLKKS